MAALNSFLKKSQVKTDKGRSPPQNNNFNQIQQSASIGRNQAANLHQDLLSADGIRMNRSKKGSIGSVVHQHNQQIHSINTNNPSHQQVSANFLHSRGVNNLPPQPISSVSQPSTQNNGHNVHKRRNAELTFSSKNTGKVMQNNPLLINQAPRTRNDNFIANNQNQQSSYQPQHFTNHLTSAADQQISLF